MAWSTREIAELAGTSVRAVRHYHEVGLLAEPDRRSNGYKQYGVSHLVRVLRIKRLTDLGFSLARIAELGDADDHPEEALRDLDADIAATIERLQRARAEVAQLLSGSAATDLPAEFAVADAVERMSDADRSLYAVLGRVLGPRALQDYSAMLRDSGDQPEDTEFEDLPADADERTRRELAERMAPYVRDLQRRHPGVQEPDTAARGGTRFARQAVAIAMQELYNPAQLDVMRRVNALAAAPDPEAEPEPGTDPGARSGADRDGTGTPAGAP